jgi:hypothetical protein
MWTGLKICEPKILLKLMSFIEFIQAETHSDN